MDILGQFSACVCSQPVSEGIRVRKGKGLNSVQVQFSSSQSTDVSSVKNPNHSIIKDLIRKTNFTQPDPTSLLHFSDEEITYMEISELLSPPRQLKQPKHRTSISAWSVGLSDMQLYWRNARGLKQNGR